ncbi:hypothetical protein NDU88_011277 [Pleurodeles waltl]|uniref:Uncharacterized protein n=1 Tax=Pleurodeles waltl TaxID=8319 RepID=A0AAV7R0H9_PLEWA|nr:hypothetical protein NDU88_011277 [Pleurodeles waltl]
MARETIPLELDDNLQEMLAAANELVARQGEKWVNAQVIAPIEQDSRQEQRAAKPRQPTRKPLWESKRAPLVRGAGGLQPERFPE